MTRLRRVAPYVLAGLTVILLGQQAINGWMSRPAPASVALSGITPSRGTDCLPEVTVLATLAARGIAATAEDPAFCATPPGLTHWYALSPTGPNGTHIAFDPAGCLQPWLPVDCPE